MSPPSSRFRILTSMLPTLSVPRLLRSSAELRRIETIEPGKRSISERVFWWRLSRRYFRQAKRHGFYISWRTQFGEGLILGHDGHGINVAPTAVIGNSCSIMQNVTIGVTISKDRAMGDAPIIGDQVFIGAGANIIGRCVIGDGARIGAGVTLVNVQVPAGAVIVNKSAYDLTNKRYIYPQD